MKRKESKRFSRSNPIYGKKLIMPFYKRIMMNSNFVEVKHCETMQVIAARNA